LILRCPRPFVIDGAKALAKAIRRSFGSHVLIQRCQVDDTYRSGPCPASIQVRNPARIARRKNWNR